MRPQASSPVAHFTCWHCNCNGVGKEKPPQMWGKCKHLGDYESRCRGGRPPQANVDYKPRAPSAKKDEFFAMIATSSLGLHSME
jgi:hypothetical protein